MNLTNRNLYYVGGVVRDEILELPSFDIDLCYEGDAIAFSKSFNVVKTNPDFGTVRILYNEQEVDIASTRTETYPRQGHLPVVDKIGCSLKDDLFRRDFTINAMAKNTLSGEIVDYFNGLSDIKNKKLRVLHDESFIEDPSRILRGLKFSVRFGFELEEKTKKLQDVYLSNINYDMSYHRLKKELKETFNLNKAIAYEKFVQQGIYKLLNKDIYESVKIDVLKIEQLVKQYNPIHVWLVYIGAYNLSNFELTSEEKFVVETFNSIKNVTPKSDYEIYKLFKQKPMETILLYTLIINYEIGIKYLEKLSTIKIDVTGDDLRDLGVPQGKIYKEIFDFLEEQIINESLTKEEQIHLVKGKFLV